MSKLVMPEPATRPGPKKEKAPIQKVSDLYKVRKMSGSQQGPLSKKSQKTTRLVEGLGDKQKDILGLFFIG